MGNRKIVDVFLQQRNMTQMVLEKSHVERAWVERTDKNREEDMLLSTRTCGGTGRPGRETEEKGMHGCS